MILAESTGRGFLLPTTIHRDGPASQLDEGQQSSFTAMALIDTGASGFFIDPSVAAALNLKQIDTSEMETAGGRVGLAVFAGLIEVPSLGFKRRVRLQAPRVKRISYEIILGREFICNYEMVIDGPSGRCSFRIPPRYNPTELDPD